MSQFTKPFTKPLIVRYIGETDKKSIVWEIQESFVYYTNSGDLIEVPVGFITDFASVPKILWNIFPPTGKYTKAAVIHDYLTTLKGRLPNGKIYSKKEVDAIFLEAMTVLKVSRVTRYMVWKAVSLFGDKTGYSK